MLYTVLLVGLTLCSHVTGDSWLQQPDLGQSYIVPTTPDNQQQLNNNPKLWARQSQLPVGETRAYKIGPNPLGAIGWQARIDPYVFIGPVLSYLPVFGDGPVFSYPPVAPALNGFGFGQYPAASAPSHVNVVSVVNAIQQAVPSPSNPSPIATTTSDAANESTVAVATGTSPTTSPSPLSAIPTTSSAAPANVSTPPITAENPQTNIAITSVPTNPPKHPKSCAEATAVSRQTGVYTIQFSRKPIQVFCEERFLGGGWMVIQRRQSNNTSFERDYAEYRKGFGNVLSDYWIGLENLHKLTTRDLPQQLMVVMKDFGDNTGYAVYDHFEVGSEEEGYLLKSLGRFVCGNVGDSLRRHEHHKFSTKDLDRDEAKVHCAERYSGAWWYHSCYDSNLNGRYGESEGVNGIVWNSFHRHGSLKAVRMLIRPRVQGRVVARCRLEPLSIAV